MLLRVWTQLDQCRLPRSWCSLWMKKSGLTSATQNSNTSNRWAILTTNLSEKKPDAKWLVHNHICVTVHSFVYFIDKGSAGFVLRLHSIWKSSYQTQPAASRHLCSTSSAVGLLQNAQKVGTLTVQTWCFESKNWITLNVYFYSSQAGKLLWDSNDSQVLPWQDRDHATLHQGGCELVYSHDGPHLWCEFLYCWNPLLW